MTASVLHFERFRALTFDCYGTLIDWESGILECLRPLLAAYNQRLSDDQILELYAEFEGQAESGDYMTYRRVLETVVQKFGQHLRFAPSRQEQESLAESLKKWQPFPDTVDALRVLKNKYRLAIISNVDDDLFAATAPLLEVPFDFVITAQQAGTYKPSAQNFQLALARIGVPRDAILHVASSLRHDIAPARALGLSTAWVNRHHGRQGQGANGPGDAVPHLEVPNLASLAALAAGKHARVEAC